MDALVEAFCAPGECSVGYFRFPVIVMVGCVMPFWPWVALRAGQAAASPFCARMDRER